MLSSEQIDVFWRDGAIVVEDAVTSHQLAQLRADFAGWLDDSRSHRHAFGAMMDGRPRFDVEPGHTPERPALRRVASPTEISDACRDVAFNSAIADMVADLIGPDVRFHHAKLNSKLPGAKTTVKWHQDFTFDPHTNDDLITALLFVDDLTPANGPLLISPGSHKGPLHSLWHEGRFTGAVCDELAGEYQRNCVACHGRAGSVCLMHSRVAHASGVNASSGARTLFIVAYAAADAVPLSANAVPSRHAGAMVRGCEPGRVRSMQFDIAMPEVPEGASFFEQQAGVSSKA